MIKCMEPVIRSGCGAPSTNLLLNFIRLEFARSVAILDYLPAIPELQLRATVQPVGARRATAESMPSPAGRAGATQE